ncbi:MAG TPA: N-acetyl-gamma-glutamyl-phosphate reductase [Lentisphaeria bacterium]|nr:MAG: N-acetyl-gamma-glutamyl-phosphate reductase [Lentisphaerae bacterium GWF2_38_69]HBM17220.1 N-acetyl-gamma-glutamyl-phosphate reductase [Lentisphaeria bacterium]
MKKIRAGIIGASGYSGEELIRLLLRHGECEISFITSRGYANKDVSEVFPRFSHLGLKFIEPDLEAIKSYKCDVIFLALPHGLAVEFAIPLLNSGHKIIDISADFRLKSKEQYKKYYKEDHPSPELLNIAVYGQPEIYRDSIRKAKLIACAGCYPTSIILPLMPLLKEKLISTNNIVVSSGSGISGAGRKVDLPYIFPECNESFRAYSPVKHRHLPEIEQELANSAGINEIKINFIPHLIPMNRGINSTIIADTETTDISLIKKVYDNYYENEQFVRVLTPPKLPDTKNVFMTNICEIGFVYDEHTGKLIVASAIDNLTKGASGQAVQCMNIMFGLKETTGLT